ncbi:MAG TPA: tryptophan synthase subunit alpha [Actinomycetota bacterium]
MSTLAIYLMASRGLPGLVEAAVEAGADLVEVGFPHSDPLADGPVIRRAGERALAEGMGPAACLEALSRARRRVEVPLVPMTYSAVLEAYGWDRFAAEALEAGASSLIVADLPSDAMPELRRVHLVAPTTPTTRIRLASGRTDGWLYLVSVAGTTGPRGEAPPLLPDLIRRARAVTALPLLAGFGIASPAHAAAAARLADGVVVGSRAVEAVEEGGPEGLRDLVAALRAALDSADSGRGVSVGSQP